MRLSVVMLLALLRLAMAAGAAAEDGGAAESAPKAIPEPPGSRGYRVAVVSPLEKVFRNDDFAPQGPQDVELSAAANEYESAQLVVEAPWRAVTIRRVSISDLKGPGGAAIPGSAVTWRRVDYITTTVKPPYRTPRGLGSYPDPLMPAGAFTVGRGSRTPIWITLKIPKQCAPGKYSGTISVVVEGHEPTALPLTLTVWNFALTDQTHLRTLTWLNGGTLRAWYGLDRSPEGNRKTAEALGNYEDALLAHRLGPGGSVADDLHADADGHFDFAPIDARLQRLIDRGMNAFIMGTAPNLRREKKTEYTPQFIAQLTAKLKAYGEHLRQKGWLDMAYVYVYDEAPKSAWPEVKKIDEAIHSAAPKARILQCLNEPEGVRELTGYADVFDVYVAQYHKAGVAQSQKKGAEVWLALCCYPMQDPNFFIEYPLIDVRVTPWICWKYKAVGFEYWSATAWGANAHNPAGKWPKVPWIANAFGKYNGDGYLLYPGEDLRPYSSIRFETLRDGLEDYEYLWTLRKLLQQADEQKLTGPDVEAARALLGLDNIIKDTGSFTPETEPYLVHRKKIAEAIVALHGRVKVR